MNERCYTRMYSSPVMFQNRSTAWDPSMGSPMDLLPLTTAFTVSLLIKRYEVDSKSYCVHQDMLISPLSLVRLEWENPVLTLLAKVPAVTRQRTVAHHHHRQKLQQSYFAMGQWMVGPQACKTISACQTQVVWPWHGNATGEKFTTDTGCLLWLFLFFFFCFQWNVCRKHLLTYLKD